MSRRLIQMTVAERERVYGLHALPHLWWELPYDQFLVERRLRMAQAVRRAWERLRGDAAIEAVASGPQRANITAKPVPWSSNQRSASIYTRASPTKRCICRRSRRLQGFWNAKGGTLLIGVADDGEVLGISADGFPNEARQDGLHLVNLIKDRIGEIFLPYVHPHFDDQQGERVLIVRCEPGPAAFLKDGKEQRFFVRGGNATTELSGAAITDYINHRFS